MNVERKPASFGDIVANLPSAVRNTASKLRRAVRAALPDCDEAIGGGGKIGMALYSLGGPRNVVCGIQPTSSGCKLFFHAWRSLEERGFVLEGSGKHARHVKIRNPEELAKVDVRTMVAVVRSALEL